MGASLKSRSLDNKRVFTKKGDILTIYSNLDITTIKRVFTKKHGILTIDTYAKRPLSRKRWHINLYSSIVTNVPF